MIFGYDLETSRIDSGTPELLYVTCYGEPFERPYKVSCSLFTSPADSRERRLTIFRDVLEESFLVPDFHRAQFIAWNGNKFDAYFIVSALIYSDEWELFPFMTASKQLRGVRVRSKQKRSYKCAVSGKRKQAHLQYQFLDGIAMTGIVGKGLKSFLQTFAPDLPKLDLDLESTDFDASNPDHVAYAERDSVGLYHGMKRVNEILTRLTSAEKLKPTIGNLAINYFMDASEREPSRTAVDSPLITPSGDLMSILHGPLKRGGYCWCQRQFEGKVWKYDINQAYAAAMRDADLPAGFVTGTREGEYAADDARPAIYEVTIWRDEKRVGLSNIPFYFKPADGSAGRFTLGRSQFRTWLTSIEVRHLLADSWSIVFHRGFRWDGSFNFGDTVARLEKLRRSDPEGPSGPLGTMVKAIGNNAYGKTLEKPNDTELCIARERPSEEWEQYDPFDPAAEYIWSRQSGRMIHKRHHLPQIGVFVTAHVRCMVRDAALAAERHTPDSFLYADTDCLVFTAPMDSILDIDPSRYGAWKEEAAGVDYLIIGKKIYRAPGEHKAKGLNTRRLSATDYDAWLSGTPPVQTQIQRNNLLTFLSGRSMFRELERAGTNVNGSAQYRLEGTRFVPVE